MSELYYFSPEKGKNSVPMWLFYGDDKYRIYLIENQYVIYAWGKEVERKEDIIKAELYVRLKNGSDGFNFEEPVSANAYQMLFL